MNIRVGKPPLRTIPPNVSVRIVAYYKISVLHNNCHMNTCKVSGKDRDTLIEQSPVKHVLKLELYG